MRSSCLRSSEGKERTIASFGNALKTVTQLCRALTKVYRGIVSHNEAVLSRYSVLSNEIYFFPLLTCSAQGQDKKSVNGQELMLSRTK